MSLYPYSDDEWETLPPTVLTSDVEWNASVLDCLGGIEEQTWYDSQSSLPVGPFSLMSDEFGKIKTNFD